MDNYTPIYEEQNVLQRAIKKLSIWGCVFLFGLYFLAKPDNKNDILQMLFASMFLGYLAFWLAGRLPFIISGVLNGTFAGVGRTAGAVGAGIKSSPNLLRRLWHWWPKSIGGLLMALVLYPTLSFLISFLQGLYSYLKLEFHFQFFSKLPDAQITFIKSMNPEWYEFLNLLWPFLGLAGLFLVVTYFSKKPALETGHQQQREQSRSSGSGRQERKSTFNENEYDASRFDFTNDRHNDRRFSTPKKKQSYVAADIAQDDKSIALDERTGYYKFKQLADEGKIKGILPLLPKPKE